MGDNKQSLLPGDSSFLEVAKQAAIAAGEVVKKYYLKEHVLQNKGHFTNFATQADLESEQTIIRILKENFPDHNIIAEESGELSNGSEFTWAIDPIDGTIPFVDGIPVFGVSIALLKNNRPLVGVINIVGQDELFWAEKDKGAFLNGEPIKVRKEDSLKQSTIGLDLGHTARQQKLIKYWKPMVDEVRYVYLFGATVFALCNIAKGRMDAYIQQAYIWDLAAGAILITEAGGKVTNLSGGEPDFFAGKPELILSNGLVHDQILEVLKS